METSGSGPARPDALLTVRAAVIFGSSLAIAIGAGVLTYLSGPPHSAGMPAAAIGAGSAAFAAAVTLLNVIISD